MDENANDDRPIKEIIYNRPESTQPQQQLPPANVVKQSRDSMYYMKRIGMALILVFSMLLIIRYIYNWVKNPDATGFTNQSPDVDFRNERRFQPSVMDVKPEELVATYDTYDSVKDFEYVNGEKSVANVNAQILEAPNEDNLWAQMHSGIATQEQSHENRVALEEDKKIM